MTHSQALRDLLADAALARLWDGARQRTERGVDDLDRSAFQVPEPTDPERSAISLVLGRPLSGRSIRIRLGELDGALRRSRHAVSLIDALALRDGPLRDRRRERAAVRRAQSEFWSGAAEHTALATHPQLGDWLERLRRQGWYRSAVRDARLPDLARALDFLGSAPYDGTDRARLASNLCGDPHALDDANAVGRLVLSALATLSGVDQPKRTDGRRRLWRTWGVEADALASCVLTLGLRPRGKEPVAGAVRGMADAGMPLHISSKMIREGDWDLAGVSGLFACENPSVLRAAADRLGGACPPFICTEGMPSWAGRQLLELAGRCGVEVRYHGDFGAGGIRIGNVVIGALGARPWRFSTADYRAVLAHERRGTEITASVPDACWDDELGDLIREEGIEVYEEQVITDLLADLERARDGGRGTT